MRVFKSAIIVVGLAVILILFLSAPTLRLGGQDPLTCSALGDNSVSRRSPLDYPPSEQRNKATDYLNEDVISSDEKPSERWSDKAMAGVVQACEDLRQNRIAGMVLTGTVTLFVLVLVSIWEGPVRRARRSAARDPRPDPAGGIPYGTATGQGFGPDGDASMDGEPR